MDSAYLQRLRFQLQKRVRRLNSCDYRLFHSSMIQFWNYVHSQPMTAGVFAKVDAHAKSFTEEIEALENGDIAVFDTEAEQIDFVYRVIQYCAKQPLGGVSDPELEMGIGISNQSDFEQALNHFREMFLEPFYEYIDEALDLQAAVLSLLVKYKRSVEWFEREALVQLADDNERKLAKHLYAYLFDQGLNFHIEPQSASGEADLVSPELVLDAKVFDGNRRGLAYLASGVHQVHTYARDFNQEVGYLIVYKTSPDGLHLEFSEPGQLAPFVAVGGKIIYIFVIDICAYEASASKRGPMKGHTVSRDFLVREIGAALPSDPDALPPE